MIHAQIWLKQITFNYFIPKPAAFTDIKRENNVLIIRPTN